MDGMGMMFKALGLDPEAIMKSAEEFRDGLSKLNANLEIIKKQQELILKELGHSVILDESDPQLYSGINGHG